MSWLSKNSLAVLPMACAMVFMPSADASNSLLLDNTNYNQAGAANHIITIGDKNKTNRSFKEVKYQYRQDDVKIEMPFNNRVRSNIGNANLSGKMVAVDYSEMGILECLFCLENKQEIQTFFKENKSLWPVVANKIYCGLRSYFETEEILLEVDEDKELFVGVKCIDSEETWDSFDRFYNEWLLENYDELKGKIYVDVFVV